MPKITLQKVVPLCSKGPRFNNSSATFVNNGPTPLPRNIPLPICATDGGPSAMAGCAATNFANPPIAKQKRALYCKLQVEFTKTLPATAKIRSTTKCTNATFLCFVNVKRKHTSLNNQCNATAIGHIPHLGMAPIHRWVRRYQIIIFKMSNHYKIRAENKRENHLARKNFDWSPLRKTVVCMPRHATKTHGTPSS